MRRTLVLVAVCVAALFAIACQSGTANETGNANVAGPSQPVTPTKAAGGSPQLTVSVGGKDT